MLCLVINHVGLCSALLSSLTHSSCVRSFTCDNPPVASSDDLSAGPETSSCVREGSEWDEGAPFASSGRSRRRWAVRRILLLRS